MGMKRHRMDSGPISSPLDALNLPQVTAADFSTSVKHSNNNLSPLLKDRDDRHDGAKMAIGESTFIFYLHQPVEVLLSEWAPHGCSK